MKILLDTNILIYREKDAVTNKSIGNLFYWITQMKHKPYVHPESILELNKYQNQAEKEKFDIKLSSYHVLNISEKPSDEYVNSISHLSVNDNDAIDDNLLFEVFIGKVDALITEDRKIHRKAQVLQITDKVFSINTYISKVSAINPRLVAYKSLAVKKELLSNVDYKNSFFDSFRNDYKGFNSWIVDKAEKLGEAYVCKNGNEIVGFLMLKPENELENYSDITPLFKKKKRLKVASFKVDSTGFRLGERFIKIIFDVAKENDVKEIYVTLFDGRPELEQLQKLLTKWGFDYWGEKISNGKKEIVIVKKLGNYDITRTVQENFPNVNYKTAKYILPIAPEFHTNLLPDSIMRNEVELTDNVAHRYALQKVYITFAGDHSAKSGDILLLYRMGDNGTCKRFTSALTTIGVVQSAIKSFKDKEDYMNHCQNRSVFSNKQLEDFWNKQRNRLSIIKFIVIKTLNKKITLQELYNIKIIDEGSGPRPFTLVSDSEFNTILSNADTSTN